jgi:hypothetical protein
VVFTEAELESTSDKSSAVAFFLPAFGLEPPAECPGAFLLPEGLPGPIFHSSSCKVQEGWGEEQQSRDNLMVDAFDQAWENISQDRTQMGTTF